MSRAINQFFNGKQVLINSLLVLVLFAVIIAYGYNCLQISNQKIILTMAGIFCAILLLIYAYALILKFFQKYSIVKLFIPVIAVAGIIYIFVFPPFSAPDGIYHYQATYSLVNLLFGLHNGDGTLPMRECDAQFMQSFITGNSISDAIVASSNQYANVLESFSNYNGNTNIVDMPSREDYAFFYNDNFPQLKIFSMFGVFIARLFNLSPAILYYFGVITNFIGYATLICIAAKIAPVGKKILMVCALLPMSLHLATSYSYDSAIIAFSILLISLILKAYFGKDKINISLTVWILVIAFLLSPCKTIYAVVGIFAFFIPNKRFI
ncbi:MAG: DUF2142 domain-containing protein, partial [Coriobacteriales bacterium]|nr:DUF2142 domain-containing protein [Coriobacteriales bacterium]